jgi:C-terminal binding-module, SLH-like, of glucodextranase
LKSKCIFVFLLILICTFAHAADYTFKIPDPRADDHGDGTILYPTESDFRAGELDLTSFAAREKDGGTMFEAEFASSIKRPDSRVIDAGGRILESVARLGFYLFNIDIYIDTDRKEGSGYTSTLPGRNAQISSAYAWEKVIMLTPRPNDARSQLRKIIHKTAEEKIRKEKGRVDPEDQTQINAEIAMDLDGRYFMPTRVQIAGRRVSFFVPPYFLRGPAQADWSYVVVVTAATIEDKIDLGDIGILGPRAGLLNLMVDEGAFNDRLGTTRNEVGLLPPIVDMVVPDGMKQEEILRNFNVNEKKPVILPGVIPSPK